VDRTSAGVNSSRQQSTFSRSQADIQSQRFPAKLRWNLSNFCFCYSSQTCSQDSAKASKDHPPVLLLGESRYEIHLQAKKTRRIHPPKLRTNGPTKKKRLDWSLWKMEWTLPLSNRSGLCFKVGSANCGPISVSSQYMDWMDIEKGPGQQTTASCGYEIYCQQRSHMLEYWPMVTIRGLTARSTWRDKHCMGIRWAWYLLWAYIDGERRQETTSRISASLKSALTDHKFADWSSSNHFRCS